MTTKAGTLYLCATPIGNLEDMTFRAVRMLREVSLIAAEDTRHTRKLLSHFDIHTPLISYHEHNKTGRGPELITRMQAGESVAVVSDAGLPGVSDPGADLVKLAIEAGLTVSPVPGPNAALSALVCSGLDTRTFYFIGFLPKTSKKRREFLGSLVNISATLILYESPHRVTDTLNELAAVLGDRPAVAGRELTKKFEEFVRGTLTGLSRHFQANPPRGEFTLVIGGEQPGEGLPVPGAVIDPVAGRTGGRRDG
jgi:16S rRNA (cytidine1402-2'-O)-methyltransferase